MENDIIFFSNLIDVDNLLFNNNIKDFIIHKPDFYKTKHIITTTDYYNLIIDDIRNMRKLDDHKLSFIFNLKKKYINTIIIELNTLLDIFTFI